MGLAAKGQRTPSCVYETSVRARVCARTCARHTSGPTGFVQARGQLAHLHDSSRSHTPAVYALCLPLSAEATGKLGPLSSPLGGRHFARPRPELSGPTGLVKPARGGAQIGALARAARRVCELWSCHNAAASWTRAPDFGPLMFSANNPLVSVGNYSLQQVLSFFPK